MVQSWSGIDAPVPNLSGNAGEIVVSTPHFAACPDSPILVQSMNVDTCRSVKTSKGREGWHEGPEAPICPCMADTFLNG
jgi:hypothetical protein